MGLRLPALCVGCWLGQASAPLVLNVRLKTESESGKGDGLRYVAPVSGDLVVSFAFPPTAIMEEEVPQDARMCVCL
jgi:hypothetical protein